jgi:ribosomal protein L7/L12
VTCQHCGSDIRITSDGKAIPFFHAAADAPAGTVLAEIRRELAAGRKIEAVKTAREQYGFGLKEALEFVEAVERGETPSVPARRDPAPPPAAPVAAGGMAEVQALALSGKKIEAIKRYRELRDTSLTEAKAAVEALERGEQPREWAPPPDLRSEAGVDWDELRGLVNSGQKLEALKRYRAQTGKSLEESLPVIDALETGRRSTPQGCNWGCARFLLAGLLFFFLIFSACGQYLRSTDLHACVVEEISASGTLQEALGSPIEVGSFLLVLGYSSSSDFGGNSERSAGYYVRVSGPEDGVLMYVEAYESSGGFFGMEANPVPNPNGFFIRTSGNVSSCSGRE